MTLSLAFHDTPNGKLASYTFSSLNAVADRAEARSDHPGAKPYLRANTWSGDVDINEACRRVRLGSDEFVPLAEKYLAEIEGKLDWHSEKFERVHSVVGGAVNVPAMLSGVPNNMILRRRTEDDAAPLTVVADLTLWAGVQTEQSIKRGAAILAMVQALAAKRPVTLWLMFSWRAAGPAKAKAVNFLIPVDTSPIDVTRTCHALAHPSFFRMLGHITLKTLDPQDGVQDVGTQMIGAAEGAPYAAAATGTNPANLLYVPPMHYDAAQADNPVEWVLGRVHEFGRAGTEE